MKIEPTYVTFEQAKLLKEKGFDSKYKLFVEKFIENARPEQWQVVEWLRVKYKINVFAIRDGGYWISKYQDFNKEEEQSPKEIIIAHKNTKEEAYSAAFDYILKELI
jgi:hypothetical protein